MSRLATFCVLGCVAWTTSVMAIAAHAADEVRALGTVEPRELAEVFAPAAGLRIKALGPDPDSATKTVDYGSHVKKNALLVQFDETENALLVLKAKAGVQRAIADYEHAKAQVVVAERQIPRAKQLTDRESGSAADIGIANAALDVARAQVRAREAAIEQAKAELKLAELHLDACTVRSPIDGVVIDRRVNAGQAVATDHALFLIAGDPAAYELWTSIEEASISKIVKGQPVRFTVAALPNQSFTGRVSQVRLNAQLNKNVVTYTVVVAVDDSKGLLPYQTANVLIDTTPSKK